jgi:hypothetical protein
MTRRDAIAEYREHILPGVRATYGWGDIPAEAEAWNNWTDHLRTDGRITMRQYDTWEHPTSNEGA